MKSIVAENTKRIIENKCLKQGLVAKKAGYDAKKFSNMVNGRKIITDMDVIRIANALEVEPNELYGFEKAYVTEAVTVGREV